MNDLPTISPVMWRWFTWYARRYVARHFNAMRFCADTPAPTFDGPIVMCANHPSWWDPMCAIAAAGLRFADRRHYAPIDAAMLEKYGIFKKLGFFGVEQDSARGSAAFLRTARRVVDQPEACLWITVQGRFADPRRRPIDLAPGAAHLMRRVTRPTAFVPVAIEYPFWTERHPEALVRYGEPLVRSVANRDASVQQCQRELTDRLTRTMDELAALAIGRDPAAFETLIRGRGGTSWIYDLWRRGKSLLTGRPYTDRHMDEAE